MKLPRRIFVVGLLLAMAAFSGAWIAEAQVSGSIYAINPSARDTGAIQTLTAANGIPSTVFSADQSGFNITRVVCVGTMSPITGTTNITFFLQNKDGATGTYYTVASGATITANSTPQILAYGAGIPLALAGTALSPIPVARTWRTGVFMTGTPISVTGKVGCSVQ